MKLHNQHIVVPILLKTEKDNFLTESNRVFRTYLCIENLGWQYVNQSICLVSKKFVNICEFELGRAIDQKIQSKQYTCQGDFD